jgi:hypothetical protein
VHELVTAPSHYRLDRTACVLAALALCSRWREIRNR